MIEKNDFEVDLKKIIKENTYISLLMSSEFLYPLKTIYTKNSMKWFSNITNN